MNKRVHRESITLPSTINDAMAASGVAYIRCFLLFALATLRLSRFFRQSRQVVITRFPPHCLNRFLTSGRPFSIFLFHVAIASFTLEEVVV
jgi:hypothetical protein